MRYKWLLVDADGTVFDFGAAEVLALQEAFGQIGHVFKPEYDPIYREINHVMWGAFERGEISQEQLRVERFARFFEAVGLPADPEAFGATYLEQLGLRADLIDGAEEVLRELHGDVGMVIITNGLADVQRSRFARSTILGYFDAVIISDEVGVAKPAPKIFDVAFKVMGNPAKEDVMIVGDSLTSDMRGGSDYGIDTCWFNPRAMPLTLEIDIKHEIRSLDELPGIVRG